MRDYFRFHEVLVSVLILMSVLETIYIVANFNRILARIAIGTVSFLSSAAPLLIVLILIIGGIGSLKWKFRRWFWGW